MPTKPLLDAIWVSELQKLHAHRLKLAATIWRRPQAAHVSLVEYEALCLSNRLALMVVCANRPQIFGKLRGRWVLGYTSPARHQSLWACGLYYPTHCALQARLSQSSPEQRRRAGLT